jgi:hypothetical protein
MQPKKNEHSSVPPAPASRQRLVPSSRIVTVHTLAAWRTMDALLLDAIRRASTACTRVGEAQRAQAADVAAMIDHVRTARAALQRLTEWPALLAEVDGAPMLVHASYDWLATVAEGLCAFVESLADDPEGTRGGLRTFAAYVRGAMDRNVAPLLALVRARGRDTLRLAVSLLDHRLHKLHSALAT